MIRDVKNDLVSVVVGGQPACVRDWTTNVGQQRDEMTQVGNLELKSRRLHGDHSGESASGVKALEGELKIEVDLRVNSEQAEVLSDKVGSEAEQKLIKINHVRPGVEVRVHQHTHVFFPIMHLANGQEREVL